MPPTSNRVVITMCGGEALLAKPAIPDRGSVDLPIASGNRLDVVSFLTNRLDQLRQLG